MKQVNQTQEEQQDQKKSVVDALFKEEDEFIIIGLTGRTGSGCSTVADLLSSKNFISKEKTYDMLNATSNEERKYNICYKYLAEKKTKEQTENEKKSIEDVNEHVNWTPAIHIKVTHLILLLCLKSKEDKSKNRERGFKQFLKDIEIWVSEDFEKEKKEIEEKIKELKVNIIHKINKYEKEKKEIEEKKLKVNSDTNESKGYEEKINELEEKINELKDSTIYKYNKKTNKIIEEKLKIANEKYKTDNKKLIDLEKEFMEEKSHVRKIEKKRDKRKKIIENVNKIIEKNIITEYIENAARIVYENLIHKSQPYRINTGSDSELDKINKSNRDKISKFLGKKGINGELAECYKNLRNELIESNQSFVETFQLFGNYIRHSSFFDPQEDKSNYSITNLLHHVIQFYRNINTDDGNPTLIVINALRNPYEIFYLRKKYATFYAMAISTDENDRKKRLHEDSNYNETIIKNFDETEYPTKQVSLEEKFVYQNIGECMEMSDIHIVNNNRTIKKDINGKETVYVGKEYLKMQLVRYISLMKHPGLVIPTHEERTMQIALMAKYNSGCISRQVGAVITDEDFAIKSIGWNNAPEGQVPCLLRDCYTLLEKDNTESSLSGLYSNFEIKQRKDDKDKPDDKTFCDCLKERIVDKITDKSILKGRTVSYCFKDIYNKQKGEKNQVHTRSLHAEENAFLQITKYGGQSIRGGKLFTTASPCELCAKKAYQLGIKDIYYIDIYPGISKEHILACGKDEFRPKMNYFEGAIGRAYLQLYQPIIPYKDEVYDILDNQKDA